MKNYTGSIRSKLSELYGLSEQTDAVEKKILAGAEQRLSVVNAELDKLRPRVNLDDSAADRYQDLILERGRLQEVIANARGRL